MSAQQKKPNRNWHNSADLDRAIAEIVAAVAGGFNRHSALVMAGIGAVRCVESSDAIRWALKEGRIFDIGSGCYTTERWAALPSGTPAKDAFNEIRVFCLHCKRETNGASCSPGHLVSFVDPQTDDPDSLPLTPYQRIKSSTDPQGAVYPSEVLWLSTVEADGQEPAFDPQAQDRSDAFGLPPTLVGAGQESDSAQAAVIPKHDRRACRLCVRGINHLRYRGVSNRTGFRSWTGTAGLVQLAKLAANAKGLTARCRPNGGLGNHLLVVEDVPLSMPPEPPEHIREQWIMEQFYGE